MSTRQKNRFDPDEQARTDEELEFVLRSLDDLDAEREEQQISARRYDELRAVYSAQAADLARRRQTMAKRRTVAAPRSRRARVGIATVAAIALIVPASMAVASSGSRSSGQTITGNTGNTGGTGGTGGTSGGSGGNGGNGAAPPAAPPTMADAKQQVDAHPQNPQAHDIYAAQLMSNGDLTGALKEFNEATRLNPSDAVGLTYSGWIAFLAGFPDKALPRLTQAESSDPTYPDPHALRGVVLLRGQKDPAAAAVELRRYLALDPSGPMSGQVKAVLDSIPQAPGK
jgi:tetratricopeptide (TPR) repeat protein